MWLNGGGQSGAMRAKLDRAIAVWLEANPPEEGVAAAAEASNEQDASPVVAAMPVAGEDELPAAALMAAAVTPAASPASAPGSKRKQTAAESPHTQRTRHR